ncbi:MAG: thiamine pyrophosphate-binding protein [Burkholderiales bacterium]
MTAKSATRPLLQTGAQILVDSLITHGADLAFGVPGESYLSVLDAMHDVEDRFKFVICRQEGGAANMADAYGKLTGEPGLCFVTRGPGASNAAVGLHTAFQDSTPLILFIGQIHSRYAERESFQEIDYRRMFGQMAKWVASIDHADRVQEMVSHAYHLATSGRPGPVVLALPEDMQDEEVPLKKTERYQRVAAHPGDADMHRLRDLLSKAKKPLVILGQAGWSKKGCEDFLAFATAYDLPVACSYRAQDMIDNRDRHYVGDVAVGLNPALAARISESDLLIAIGSRLGEWSTVNYTLLDIPRPKQPFVHIYPGAEELGRVYQADLLINSGMPEFAAAARKLPPLKPVWSEWTKAARADLEAWQQPVQVPGKVNMSEIMVFLRERLPKETIVTNGAGNFSLWVHRFYRYGGFRTQLGPTSGAMGYGVPAGVGARLVHPKRPVIAFAGDGDFLMTGQELATAAQYGAKVIFIVVNNGMYGTIRMHQERHFPARVSGTMLQNPDFAALARAYGLHGEIVEATADFEAAFERAWSAKTAALIEVRVDPEAISPRTTLAAIRAEAKKSAKK